MGFFSGFAPNSVLYLSLSLSHTLFSCSLFYTRALNPPDPAGNKYISCLVWPSTLLLLQTVHTQPQRMFCCRTRRLWHCHRERVLYWYERSLWPGKSKQHLPRGLFSVFFSAQKTESQCTEVDFFFQGASILFAKFVCLVNIT